MFGAAPIERSSLTASQKSKSPSPAGSVTAARSEKELTQLLMSGSSMEHLTMTRSGSAGQLGMSSTATLSSGGGSVFSATNTRSMRQPVENTQRGCLTFCCTVHREVVLPSAALFIVFFSGNNVLHGIVKFCGFIK